jgi:hypothetical protein
LADYLVYPAGFWLKSVMFSAVWSELAQLEHSRVPLCASALSSKALNPKITPQDLGLNPYGLARRLLHMTLRLPLKT